MWRGGDETRLGGEEARTLHLRCGKSLSTSAISSSSRAFASRVDSTLWWMLHAWLASTSTPPRFHLSTSAPPSKRI